MEPRSFEPTRRSTLRRKRERGSYDRETVYSILDEGLVCHVGFADAGSVFVVPTTYARVGDELYLHGAAANRMLKSLASGAQVCVTVTLLDGLVFSRSAFHHSMNYRSVMVLGSAVPVTDPGEKLAAVLAIVDHMAEGRSSDARRPTPTELKSTAVVRIAITEASAKVRSGGPVEEAEDLALAVWGGELPLVLEPLEAVADPQLPPGVELPGYVARYRSRLRPATRSRPGPGAPPAAPGG